MDCFQYLTGLVLLCYCSCNNNKVTERLDSTASIGMEQYKPIKMPAKCRVGNSTSFSVRCSCNNTDVGMILQLLPSNIERLTFHLDEDQAQYPVPSINLTYISHLHNLEYLKLTGGSLESTNRLIFHADTFENITKVKELHISVVIYNKNLGKIVRYMKYLEILDLSYTNRLSIDVIQKLLISLNTKQLNELILRSVQMPGVSRYSDALNISSVFSSDNFLPLKHLDLSRNMLGVIYPSTVSRLPNLKSLDISHNNLLAWTNDAMFVELLLHPTLEVLNMQNQGQGYLQDRIMGKQKNKSSIVHKAHTNSGKFGHSGTIQKILTCINDNSHGNFTQLFIHPKVFCSAVKCVGQLSSHVLKGIPCEAFGTYGDSFDSSCPYFFRFPIIKRLKQFIAGDLNWINRPTPRMRQDLCMSDSPLRNLSFNMNGNWIKSTFLFDLFEKLTFSSPFKYLMELNLRSNDLRFIPKGVLTSLQTLDLGDNHIEPSSKSVCEMYPNLRYISLAKNDISSLHVDFFGTCQYLENLDLSQNALSLTHTQFNIAHNIQLKNVNLNSNKIDTLPIHFTNQLDTIARIQGVNKTELKLTFQENNLVCQCNSETLAFIPWFQSTDVVIPHKESYSCSTSQGEVFLSGIDVDEFRQSCFPSYTKLIVESVLATVGAVAFLITLAGIYRYRWRLQYRFVQSLRVFQCKRQNNSIMLNDIKDTSVKYDVFVSYCAEDRFWVHDCLMKTLEGDKYGLKLCIHYRDFPLGEDISSVIVKSIHQSRKVIIVLSENSIGRPWCQFEFQVALSEVVKRKEKLAIIKLGNFSVEEVDDSSVAWVLDNHTYLEWHENKKAQNVFWFKLLRHIYNEIDGSCCCFGPKQLNSNDVAAFAETDKDTCHMI